MWSFREISVSSDPDRSRDWYSENETEVARISALGSREKWTWFGEKRNITFFGRRLLSENEDEDGLAEDGAVVAVSRLVAIMVRLNLKLVSLLGPS